MGQRQGYEKGQVERDETTKAKKKLKAARGGNRKAAVEFANMVWKGQVDLANTGCSQQEFTQIAFDITPPVQ